MIRFAPLHDDRSMAGAKRNEDSHILYGPVSPPVVQSKPSFSQEDAVVPVVPVTSVSRAISNVPTGQPAVVLSVPLPVSVGPPASVAVLLFVAMSV